MDLMIDGINRGSKTDAGLGFLLPVKGCPVNLGGVAALTMALPWPAAAVALPPIPG